MGPICYALVLLAPISLAITLIAHVTAYLLLSPARRRGAGPTPPITVLKPVKGAEEGLYENLASLARQEYADYEILVGAEDALDPALDVARRVQVDHPGARIRVQAGSRSLGLNPKVNLLAALADGAKHEHLLISDSNVRVGPRYLRETAAELADPSVGLVTNLVVGSDADGVGGVLEALHLESFVACGASFARAVGGRACVIGKSMLFRRGEFERLGGFRSFCDVLAEDYLIGRAYETAGYKVALSPHLVPTVNRSWTVERFVKRHVRWAQMRRQLSLPAYAGELLLNPVPWIMLALCATRASDRLPHRLALAAALLAIVIKCASDALLSRRLRGKAPDLSHVLLIPVKDWLMACIWLVGAFRRTVDWRGNVLRIGPGTALEAGPDRPLERPLEEAA